MIGTDAFAVRTARMIFRKGTVLIQKNSKGSWKSYNPTMRLTENDRIKTGKNSKAEIRFDDGTKMQLLSNTIATLKNYNLSKTGRKSNVVLKKGSVFANVSRLKRKSSFRVSTVTGVAGVRGTQFYVSINKKKKMKVEVYKGKVNVSAKNKTVIVKANQQTTVEKGKAPKKAKKIVKKRKIKWMK